MKAPAEEQWQVIYYKKQAKILTSHNKFKTISH